MKTVVMLGVIAGVGAAVAKQMPEIRRYMRMRAM